jgi:hypothetical protein
MIPDKTEHHDCGNNSKSRAIAYSFDRIIRQNFSAPGYERFEVGLVNEKDELV